MARSAAKKSQKWYMYHRQPAMQKAFKNQWFFDGFPFKNIGFYKVCWSAHKKKTPKKHPKPLVFDRFFSSKTVIRLTRFRGLHRMVGEGAYYLKIPKGRLNRRNDGGPNLSKTQWFLIGFRSQIALGSSLFWRGVPQKNLIYIRPFA